MKIKILLASVLLSLTFLYSHGADYDIVVAKDGSGDFTSVQEAVNSVPDFRKKARTRILVKKGEYKEKVIIPPTKINLSLIGEDGAVITYDDYASKLNRFGDEKSTSGSATIYIYPPDFIAENMTFANTAGRVGQAVACFVDGDRALFRNCRFLGDQDTLYTYGDSSRQYYDNCYIEGTVDFIFGKASAVFNNCHIHSKSNGYVAAPATPEGKEYGYVFYDCKLTGGEEAEKVYLSRPWRPYAQAVFIRCDLGKHITSVGWDNWGKVSNEQTAKYAEFMSKGPGANPESRVGWSKQLTDLSGYDMRRLLSGTDGWNPVDSD